jgi:hypothetical protein
VLQVPVFRADSTVGEFELNKFLLESLNQVLFSLPIGPLSSRLLAKANRSSLGLGGPSLRSSILCSPPQARRRQGILISVVECAGTQVIAKVCFGDEAIGGASVLLRIWVVEAIEVAEE